MASTAGYPYSFRTQWGKNEFQKRMQALHNMPTLGQAEAIARQVSQAEDREPKSKPLPPTEYDEAMKEIELYEKLLREG